nr:hypothetical protein [Tanacetum cinerariifolium]
MYSKKQDKMYYPRFTNAIIYHFLTKDKPILMRNRTFMHTAQNDSLLGTIRFVSKHEDTQVYGALLPKAITNQAILDSDSYKTYYAIATGAEPPMPKKTEKKSSDGNNFESWVPDEQQCKISRTNEGNGDSGEEDDDDEDESDDDKGNDDDGDNDDNDDDSDHERTRVHTPKNYELTDKEDYAINAKEENKEEKDNAEELYKDVNVKLRKKDVEITDVDHDGADQHNVSQESGFEHVEEDAHVTLITFHDTQKTEGPMLSSSVSSDITNKLLNFENASLADNEIASLMDTTVRHEEPSSQRSSFFTIPVTVILEIMYAFTITIPLPPPSFNPFPQQATPTPTPTASEVTTLFLVLPYFSSIFRFNDRVTKMEKDLSEINNKLGEAIKSHTAECREESLADKREYIDLIDTSVRAIIKEEVKTQLPQIFPQAVSDFATPVIKGNVTKSLEAILIDKMEEHKSYLRAEYKKELYDVLVKSYNPKKDLFETYGEVFTLKMSRDDKDKDQDPSAGSDQGIKRRKTSKDAESSRNPKSKESKSPSSYKEFDAGNNDEQSDDEAASKFVWFKKPERPLTLDPDWNKSKSVDFRPPQTWISNIARAEKPPTSFDELMDTPIDFSTLGLKRQRFYGFASNKISTNDVYSIKRIIAVTSLKIMKWYDYGHLEKIEVCREDQQLYKFKECDFPRICLQDIKDMLLLLVQQKLTNLTIDERYDLNVALCMFTRRIVIQRRVEDL